MTKYVLVHWPEIQNYVDNPRFKECYSCNALENSGDDDDYQPAYMVPEDLYDEVMYKLEFPKKYENTNLGTIVCYETRAVINGEDSYWYDEGLLKRGCKVLVYKHDTKEWIITKCIACSFNMPILLEDKTLFPGINCKIIGVKQEENIQNEN